MSEHTPGPWVAAHDFIYDSNHRRVADAAPWSPTTKERPDETVHANARLIAAAPDLLAACRLAARYLDPRHYSDAVRDIDAAIAKATGQDAAHG